jgi:peptidase M23-like protein
MLPSALACGVALLGCGGGGPAPVAVTPVPAAPAPAAPAAPTPVAPALPAPVAPIPDGAITVRVLPAPTYVELRDGEQLVNCDLLVTNTSTADWTLIDLQVSAFDRAGTIGFRKFLNRNGVSPSITTIPNRELAAGKRVLVLNPLYEFPRDLELGRLRFELTYARTAGEQRMTAMVEVSPMVYANHARLKLPIRGRFIVWDGHDFLAHHRRWDYVFEPIRALGFDSNSGRYSYDLIPIDEAGAMVHGEEADNASWLGFGAPIHAPAPGTIVAVVDDRPDDRKFDTAALKTDLLAVFGNYVVLDHGHGEVSVFGHIQQHSAKQKVGARVSAGQVLAAIGASGSSLMPHLHYQLQTTPTGHAEGLPSYFEDFTRVRGRKRIEVPVGQIDSGDIIISQER